MSVLTKARSGVARSGATRSGYPIQQGAVAKTYALSGVCRSGATRSNYHSCKPFLTVNGAVADTEVGSLGLSTVLNHTPNVGSFTTQSFVPAQGQVVVATLGSINNLQREFGGYVISKDVETLEDIKLPRYTAHLIDYTWRMDVHKATGQFTGATVATIAAWIATFLPAGYTLSVAADIGAVVVDSISFTMQQPTACFTQLTKRVGGDWICDTYAVVRLFYVDATQTQPSTINAVNPLLVKGSLKVNYDLSQVRTRILAEGGGTNALTSLPPGETSIPIENVAWYPTPSTVNDGTYTTTRGWVTCGAQRISYTGVQVNGGGGLVGPGAAPSSAPTLALANGTNIESGVHSYAVVFVTAAGKSLPGPLATITTGTLATPVAAPAIMAPTIGTGPDPGAHTWAVTFVTAVGETTVGPTAVGATTLTAAPSTTLTSGSVTIGGAVTPGLHDYAVSFVTAIGETTPGPISSVVSTGLTSPPSTALTPGPPYPVTSGGIDDGYHTYAMTFVTAVGETTPSPVSAQILAYTVAGPSVIGTAGNLGAGGGTLTAGATYRYKYTFLNTYWYQETVPSPASNSFVSDGFVGSVDLSGCQTPPTGCVRQWYRTSGNGSTYQFINTGQNFGQCYESGGRLVDNCPDGFLGAAAVRFPSLAFHQVNLTAIPTGDANCTARKVYRTKAGGSTLFLLATIADNTTTTFLDTIADAGLGAAVPSTSTAYLQTISLSGIPLGDANCTSRNLYRRSGGAGLKLLDTIADNTTTTYSDTTANASLGADALTVSTAYLQQFLLTGIPLGPALCTKRRIYRSAAGTTTPLKLAYEVADNTTNSWTDTVTDASLGASAPSSNTAYANQVALSAIPLGAAAITSREIYRTVAGGTALKYLHTLADNTTTTWADSAADATLGASVPVADTSGLTQPAGQVLAGSTTILVANSGGFQAAGGWAIIGNGQQVIRYTGITANTLTGIPASGYGSVVASVAWNSTITNAPCLTGVPASGVGSILYPIKQGDPVNLLVIVNAPAAQTAMAALVKNPDGTSNDGVVEDFLQDGTLGDVECVAQAKAQLALVDSPLVTIDGQTYDVNMKAGRTVPVNIGSPYNVFAASFLVQHTEQTVLESVQGHSLRSFTASSLRFTLDDLIRMIGA